MKNLSLRSDKIIAKAKRGYPDGVSSEQSVKDMSVLINRINELERALIPFVRVGLQNNFGDTMVNIRHEDCVKAAQIMDRANALPDNHPIQEYIPAEY